MLFVKQVEAPLTPAIAKFAGLHYLIHLTIELFTLVLPQDP